MHYFQSLNDVLKSSSDISEWNTTRCAQMESEQRHFFLPQEVRSCHTLALLALWHQEILRQLATVSCHLAYLPSVPTLIHGLVHDSTTESIAN